MKKPILMISLDLILALDEAPFEASAPSNFLSLGLSMYRYFLTFPYSDNPCSLTSLPFHWETTSFYMHKILWMRIDIFDALPSVASVRRDFARAYLRNGKKESACYESNFKQIYYLY